MSDITKQEFLNESMQLLNEFRSESVHFKARQAALQGLSDALISLTPTFRKTGACWCEHWKNVQNGHSEKCKQASAALEAAKPFLEKK